MQDQQALVDRFSQLKVAILGDVMLDRYWCGTSQRICPDVPAPVVDLIDEIDVPGGAGNVAANVASLGASAQIISAIGNDQAGHRVRELLKTAGVATRALWETPRETIIKHRIVADQQVLARVDRGTGAAVNEEVARLLVEGVRAALTDCHALIISDYGYGIVTDHVLQLLEQERKYGGGATLLAVDSRQLPRYARLRPTVVKPNQREAAELLQRYKTPSAGAELSLRDRGQELLEICRSQMAVVTLSGQGALLWEWERPMVHAHSQPISQAHASGAGDTFLAALVLALAAGASGRVAADLANCAARCVVQKPGTATCSGQELSTAIGSPVGGCLQESELLDRLAIARQRGQRIVLTCGCFDIIHSGHVACLSQAKQLGDVLVVAVNSDASVARLKGATRPLNPLPDRMAVLSSLGMVDYVLPFDEDRPHRVIVAVQPDVFVKGGDYSRETLTEAPLVEEFGGKVVIIPLVGNRSTTRLVSRIRDSVQTAGGT